MPEDTPVVVVFHKGDYVPGKEKCEADYDYYERDGKRIKHGACVYKYIGQGGGKDMIAGEFVDGKKHGPWLFTSLTGEVTLDAFGNLTYEKRKSYYTKQNSTPYYALLNYKNDELNGPFKAHLKYNQIKFEGEMKNGHPVGKMSATISDYVGTDYLKIDGSFDEQGLPMGVWTVARIAGVLKTQTLTYENGILTKMVEVDDSTGESTDMLPSGVLYTRDLSLFKKVKLRAPNDRETKIFYKSNETGQYFSAREGTCFGIGAGCSEECLSLVHNSFYCLGVQMGHLYLLTPADAEVSQIETEIKIYRKRKELEAKSKSIWKLLNEISNICKEVHQCDDRLSREFYYDGRKSYFYSDAKKIITESLKYDPKAISEEHNKNYTDLLKAQEALNKQNITLDQLDAIGAHLDEIEKRVNAMIKYVSFVLEISKNIESVYLKIDKKVIKTLYKPMTENKDAAGLIKLFTEDYKQYIL